jgi:hypothetical protein
MNIDISEIADTTAANKASLVDKTQMSSESISTIEVTKFSIYDINSGGLVKQWSYGESENIHYNISVAGIKAGVYILKMERKNKVAITKIIIR